jgi:hypothetical protein
MTNLVLLVELSNVITEFVLQQHGEPQLILHTGEITISTKRKIALQQFKLKETKKLEISNIDMKIKDMRLRDTKIRDTKIRESKNKEDKKQLD